MPQIEHDPNEPPHGKPSIWTVLTISAVLGGGLALSRIDWEAVANSDESVIDAAIFLIGLATIVVGVTYGILKAWDRLTGR